MSVRVAGLPSRGRDRSNSIITIFVLDRTRDRRAAAEPATRTPPREPGQWTRRASQDGQDPGHRLTMTLHHEAPPALGTW